VPTLPEIPQIPPGLLADLRRDPTYALETLALAAVDVHGPAAAHWAGSGGKTRDAQAKLARTAIRRASISARVEGAALGIGGFVTMAPDALALAWIVTREIIFVAAAHGQDPTDPARAAEVLVVAGVYDSVPKAQAALDHRGERLATALAKQQVIRHFKGQDRSFSQRVLRAGGQRVARRYGGRLVPGLGAVLGSIDNAAIVRRMGDAAIEFYRGR
jgi:hypothetical protein